MWIRSTGLGKTELKVRVDGIRREGDCLILSLRTVELVNWHVRAVVEGADLLQMIKYALRFSVLFGTLKSISLRRNAKKPEDY